MRKNQTFMANIPKTRNEFIDCVNEKKEVIVLSNALLAELDKEVRANLNKRKTKKALKVAGITGLLILNLFNPLTWVFGIGSLLVGGLLKNELKGYAVHKSFDVNDQEILILTFKKRREKCQENQLLQETGK